jgi:hypothetical protein
MSLLRRELQSFVRYMFLVIPSELEESRHQTLDNATGSFDSASLRSG